MKRMVRTVLAACAVLLMLLVPYSVTAGQTSSIPRITVMLKTDGTLKNRTITNDVSLQIVARLNGQELDSRKLMFTSSNEKVAVVDSEGIITTEGQGIADITAQTKDGRQKAVIRLKVKKNAVSGWSDSFEGQSGKDALSVWQRSNGDGSM
jgi:hypothetical protein